MEDPLDPWHVYPVGEEELHCLVGNRCLCFPDTLVDADGVVIVSHNSFDGREWSEKGYVRLN